MPTDSITRDRKDIETRGREVRLELIVALTILLFGGNANAKGRALVIAVPPPSGQSGRHFPLLLSPECAVN